MAEHSSIDSVSEPSGTAKTSSKSDNIFSIMNDHRQLISPGYDNNISGFQASIENINVGGGVMSNAPVTHTPKVATPDIYNMLLQNQLYIQTLMKNQNSRTDTTQSSIKVNPRQSATMAGPRKVVKNKPKKDDYQSQLDSLFDNDMNNNQTKNISAPSELYSDISSDESYDSDDEACSENEVDNDIEKAENENVLESMKDFISSVEKTGPKINYGLASYMNQGLRTRVNEEKNKDLTKKYDKPANVCSLKDPRVNIGIWKQMTPQNKDVDVKLQRLQNLLSKTACPLIYMMDMFVDKSSKKEGMSREELQTYAVTCRDTYQLFQACYSKITFRRRSFIKGDIQPQYKGLCDDTTPVTDMLFGDDIKEKIKELDAEHSVCKKGGKNHNYTPQQDIQQEEKQRQKVDHVISDSDSDRQDIAKGQRLQTIHSLDLDNITVTYSNIYIDVKSLLKCSKPGRHLQPIKLPDFIEDNSLCIVTVLKEYLVRTSCFRKTQKLILSCIKPYSHVSKDTLGRWIKIGLQMAGVDITIYKPHSTRSASTSATLRCATSVDIILKAAGWSNESTFRKFYDKPVSKQNYNDNYSVKVLRSHILSNSDKSHE
ncbi:unnamed protein product [Mytilus coruscus]|uniref:Tyr recombinase domain-containing protein n=1 Tax=Mytilus coruscus TaxID=42192 RepID=A0A6J8BX56_MYTCO|nr:unnamed protein product [Mytilus coruscus]